MIGTFLIIEALIFNIPSSIVNNMYIVQICNIVLSKEEKK